MNDSLLDPSIYTKRWSEGQEVISQVDLKEMITHYCSNVNTNVLWVLGAAAAMIIFEPKLRSLVDEHKNEIIFDPITILFVYKWIYLGLIFIVGYGIWMIG